MVDIIAAVRAALKLARRSSSSLSRSCSATNLTSVFMLRSARQPASRQTTRCCAEQGSSRAPQRRGISTHLQSSAYQPRFDPCGLLSERDRRIPGRRLDYEFQFRGSLIEIALGDRGNPAQDGVSALFAAACHSNRHSGRRVVGSQWDAHIQFTDTECHCGRIPAVLVLIYGPSGPED